MHKKKKITFSSCKARVISLFDLSRTRLRSFSSIQFGPELDITLLLLALRLLRMLHCLLIFFSLIWFLNLDFHRSTCRFKSLTWELICGFEHSGFLNLSFAMVSFVCYCRKVTMKLLHKDYQIIS